MDIRNSRDLKIALGKIASDVIDDVAEKVELEMKSEIDNTVYGAGVPDVYERTYQLRDSYERIEDRKTSNGRKITLGHNFDKIKPSTPNQHVSVFTGKPFVSGLPIAIHGGAGYALGRGFWTKPRPYYDNLIQRLEAGRLDEIIESSLSKY